MLRGAGDKIEGTMRAVKECRHPTVAMIHGACVGGRFEIASQCDFRVCGESSRFGIPINNLSLEVGYGEMAALIGLVGRATALEILLEGCVFGAGEAKDKGPVSRVVADSAVESEALATAERDEGYACFDTEDYRTGFKALLVKQKPQFRGE